MIIISTANFHEITIPQTFIHSGARTFFRGTRFRLQAAGGVICTFICKSISYIADNNFQFCCIRSMSYADTAALEFNAGEL